MTNSEQQKKADALHLVRLKNAADEYKVHKSIFVDPVTGEPQNGFMPWVEFRDAFLADWSSNRRVVTEKEADVIFERIADESLNELDVIGASDVSVLAEQVVQSQDEDDTIGVIVESPVTGEPVAVPKRRGRPAGSKKEATPFVMVEANDAGSVVPAVETKRRGRPAGKTSAKKKGKNTSTQAEALILKYGPKGRKWSRKDVIAKLVASIDGLGVAYASTLYQKFA